MVFERPLSPLTNPTDQNTPRTYYMHKYILHIHIYHKIHIHDGNSHNNEVVNGIHNKPNKKVTEDWFICNQPTNNIILRNKEYSQQHRSLAALCCGSTTTSLRSTRMYRYQKSMPATPPPHTGFKIVNICHCRACFIWEWIRPSLVKTWGRLDEKRFYRRTHSICSRKNMHSCMKAAATLR